MLHNFQLVLGAIGAISVVLAVAGCIRYVTMTRAAYSAPQVDYWALHRRQLPAALTTIICYGTSFLLFLLQPIIGSFILGCGISAASLAMITVQLVGLKYSDCNTDARYH